MSVAVITDSTASIPEQVAAESGVSVVPVQIVLDGDIDDESRFDRGTLIQALRSERSMSTQPPDPGAFFWTYQDAVSAGAEAIVSLHISGRMSATIEAAREAATQVHVPVHVLDSGTTSMSLGFAALSAARTAAAGGRVEQVIEAAGRRCRTSTELIYVDTLHYLRRGGRIGTAATLAGTALSLKPLLTVESGEVAPLARIPGSKRALNRLVQIAVERSGGHPVDIAVSCVTQTEQETQVIQQLREHIPALHNIMLVPASTVVTTHVGPDALGVTIAPTP